MPGSTKHCAHTCSTETVMLGTPWSKKNRYWFRMSTYRRTGSLRPVRLALIASCCCAALATFRARFRHVMTAAPSLTCRGTGERVKGKHTPEDILRTQQKQHMDVRLLTAAIAMRKDLLRPAMINLLGPAAIEA